MAHKDTVKNDIRQVLLRSGNVKTGEGVVFQGKTADPAKSRELAIAARRAELKGKQQFYPTGMDEQQGERS